LIALESRVPPEAEAILRPAPPPAVEPLAVGQPAQPAVQTAAKPPPLRLPRGSPAAEPAPPVPAPPVPALDPAAARLRQEVLDQMAIASAKVLSTEQIFERVRSDLAARGLSPRPGVVADMTRMKILLEQAGSDASRGNYAAARETLGVVEALASRVSREYGR
jgi:hypothetical protein